MEYAKFIFEFDNNLRIRFFNHSFTKLDSVHKYNTKQKERNEFFEFRIASKSGRKTQHDICLIV